MHMGSPALFSQTDIDTIDQRYFILMEATAHVIVLCSRYTGHQWLMQRDTHGGVRLSHRHSSRDPWHPQAYRCSGPHTLFAALHVIRSHDAYVLHTVRIK